MELSHGASLIPPFSGWIAERGGWPVTWHAVRCNEPKSKAMQ